MHLGDITGSLEPGKRADLIVVDLDQPHTTPRFERDPTAIYSQLVYAAKSTDVVDVMCDGRWLMRDRRLLTLDEADLQSAARDVARRIDAFLVEREQSVLQKLIAIGGAAEQESFEIQVKARLASEDAVLRALESEDITIIRTVHYHQFDTYFFFDDPEQGRLRYREDEFLDEQNQVVNARARLTLTGPSREGGVRVRAAVSFALFRTGDALASLLSRVLQAGTRTRGREGSPAMARRLPRRPVLRAPRSPAESARPTATSSKSSRAPGRAATPRTRRRSSRSCSSDWAPGRTMRSRRITSTFDQRAR